MKLNRPLIKSHRRFRRVSGGVFLGLSLAGILTLFFHPEIIVGLLYASQTKSRETTYASPDGAYVASIRDVEIGALASFSTISLKSKWNVLPPLTSTRVTDGRYRSFGPVRWTGNRTLQVTYRAKGPPDKSWTTYWHGVKIVYASAS